MRFVCAFLCVLIILPTASAQLLTFDEILVSVEGRWGVPYEHDDNPDNPRRCDQAPLLVRIVEANGALIFESRDLGTDEVFRSKVMAAIEDDGSYAPFILIQYEGELRQTESGEPVTWRLFMTDSDTFYWQRTDWPRDGFTPPRARCTDPFPAS